MPTITYIDKHSDILCTELTEQNQWYDVMFKFVT